MASIYKQPGSRFWFARYRLPDGKWTAKTTKQKDRGAALRTAYELEGLGASAVELSPVGAALARNVREIYERATRQKVEAVTVGDFLRQWVARIEATKSANTGSRYKQIVDLLLAYLGPQGERRNLASLTPTILQGFIDSQSATGKGAHTVALAGKILSIALKSAVRAGLLERNPAGQLDLPAFAMKEREEFSAAELESLLAEARGTEWETAVLLGAYCGARLGDATSMRWENVDLAGAKVTFTPQKTSRRGNKVELPIPPRVLAHLEGLAGREDAQHNEFITPGLAARGIGGRTGLSLSFRALMRRSGVSGKTTARAKDSAARSFSTKSFHSLRHFFIANMHRGGADAETAQAGAGHSDAKVHERYDHDKRDRVARNLKAAVENIPGAKGK